MIRRFSQELAAEGWQGLRRRLIVLHARFYAAVLVVLLVSISFYTQPVVAVLAMFSFWVPQIAHSAYYGTKPAFHPVYLLGTSSARCFIPLYVLGCPHNFLSLLGVYMNPHYLAGMADSAAHSHAQAPGLSAASYSACWVLVLWMTAQVGVLLLQGSLGPRFFVPKQWLPSKYDYHRPIPAHLRALPASVATAIATTTSSSGGGFNGDTRAAVSSSSAGDLEMTGMRSRNSASLSPNGSYASRLQALLGFSRPEDSAGADRDEDGNGEGDQEDAETGRLLGERHQYPLSQQGGVSVAASATVAERNELECVICYNHITQGSFDYMVRISKRI